MQIFSPFCSFIDISNHLDNRRLNKQKVEIYQILNCISLGDNAKGWKNHPAVKMARGHELFFIDYALEIADSCLRIGYKDTLIPKIKAFRGVFKGEYKIPFYWGDERFHSSHRAALLAKDYNYYSKFGWKESPIVNYVWPV